MIPDNSMGLAEAWAETARQHRDSRAVVAVARDNTSSTVHTYGQLDARVRELGRILRGQLAPASVVAIVMPNGIEYVLAFLAIISAGLVAAPHNPMAKEEELDFFLQDTGAALVLAAHEEGQSDSEPVDSDRQRRLSTLTCQLGIRMTAIGVTDEGVLLIDESPVAGAGAIASPDTAKLECPSGTVLLLHTSGTTAKPKLVPLLSASLVFSAHQLAAAYEIGPPDVLLLVMPLFHVHGLVGNLLTSLLAGAAVVLPRRFSASHFLELAATHRATWFSAVPTIYQILYADPDQYLHPEHLASVKKQLRFIRSCSAAIPATLLRQLMATFGVPVVQAYGMTESTHMGATGTPSAPGPLGSVGRALPGRTVKILSPEAQGRGEICFQGPGMLESYLKPRNANVTAFTTDGYFRTGDLGYVDEQGYLFVVGRVKELINRGGEKINPHEVENILLMGPVREAVCFALPDPLYGEQVAAVVVPACWEDAHGLEGRLTTLCHEHLSAFKCPTRLFVVQEIPKSAIGKIQRAYLTRFFST